MISERDRQLIQIVAHVGKILDNLLIRGGQAEQMADAQRALLSIANTLNQPLPTQDKEPEKEET